MRQNLIGTLNGDIRLFLLLSQALGQAVHAIMSNNKFQFQILKHSADPKDIDTGDKIMTLTLVNVYGPNENNPAFLETCVTSVIL